MQPRSLDYAGYTIDAAKGKDTALVRMLQPYRDSVEAQMGATIGIAAATLEKKQPSGSLGNFMADAVLQMARTKYNRTVDFSILNFGGIRIPQLPQGAISRGKIFELMPFDNLLVLQELSGDQVQQLLDFIAAHGGWPVAGVSFSISNKKAVDIKIGNTAFDINKKYVIANSDYIANGGDNASFLKDIPQITNGYLIRDALIEYLSQLQQQGKQIEATNEMRINYVQ
jgi:2',3'-cyclic-nucleotide 2'-phosphodiesterase (5'-nucleotidase family)